MILFPFLLVVWGVALFLLLKPVPTTSNKYEKGANVLASALGYEKIQKKTNSTGTEMTATIYVTLVISSFLIGLFIALLIGNYFFIALGVLLGYTVPLHLVKSRQRSRRNEMLFETPEFLKIYTSKLLDFSNAAHAMKEALEDYDGVVKPYFKEASDSLQMGFSLDRVLLELKEKIRLRRFNEFADKLLTAEENGYTLKAVNSLKETIRGMSEDAIYVKELQIKAKSEMKSTYVQAAMLTCLPLLLSGINTNNVNVFMDTVSGQIYITIFVGTIMFCILRKTECLSLNLTDL
ncbi:hypothetical protein WJ0W_007112 [Paenibacillus melissococcoides]|uniref:Type II secretion system protein GspF domain-containing protein n=1 Tax=Paenibacillus melissococcoides TaxID=2912268 RepID=A0ABN8UB95_9BACL|nr:hypothetical protein [Paenibacillus melissococcoides]CAH8248444.1 hypothetical protein WJ0W_007112 [Paenibacillus melissococcoides]CAH8722071.1 hypothetical protein HTL2_006678 [Paenibacillus melissococcoides]CAH8722095.1 hypothetical protein WDD9_006617 [Paenibacillus melissococcoides]